MRRALVLASLWLVSACSNPPTISPDGGTRHDAGTDAGSDAGACPGASGCPACQNGADDDGDGRADYPLDPGCERRTDDDESEPAPPGPCANDADDDGDGLADYPADPGCADEEDGDETDPPPPACANGSDDDGDDRADFPADPGCASARDDDESDACPSGACPACADGVDGDGDGATDYPDDAECSSAADDDERCALTGSFDDDWPGAWVVEGGFPPFMAARRGSAAHDGPFGLLNTIELLRDPSVTTGTPGEIASVWVRTLGESNTTHALVFAIGDTGSYECMLSYADRLSIFEAPQGTDGTMLESTDVPIDLFTWYRLEVAFLDAGEVECRVYRSDGTTLLSSVSHDRHGHARGARDRAADGARHVLPRALRRRRGRALRLLPEHHVPIARLRHPPR